MDLTTGERIRYAVGGGLAFLVFYGGANFWSESLPPVSLPKIFLEMMPPFRAEFSLIYLSVLAPLNALAFLSPTRDALRRSAVVLGIELIAASICFVAIPFPSPSPPDALPPIWMPYFNVLDGLNLDRNLFPSLHVAFAVTCAELFGERCGSSGRTLWRLWAGMVALSTVYLHQHYIIDVIGGFVLAISAMRFANRINRYDFR